MVHVPRSRGRYCPSLCAGPVMAARRTGRAGPHGAGGMPAVPGQSRRMIADRFPAPHAWPREAGSLAAGRAGGQRALVTPGESAIAVAKTFDHGHRGHKRPFFLGIKFGDRVEQPFSFESSALSSSLEAICCQVVQYLAPVCRMRTTRDQPFSLKFRQRGAHRLRLDRLGARQIGRRHRASLLEFRQGGGLRPGKLVGI